MIDSAFRVVCNGLDSTLGLGQFDYKRQQLADAVELLHESSLPKLQTEYSTYHMGLRIQ